MNQATLLRSPTGAQEVRGPKTQPLSAYQSAWYPSPVPLSVRDIIPVTSVIM